MSSRIFAVMSAARSLRRFRDLKVSPASRLLGRFNRHVDVSLAACKWVQRAVEDQGGLVFRLAYGGRLCESAAVALTGMWSRSRWTWVLDHPGPRARLSPLRSSSSQRHILGELRDIPVVRKHFVLDLRKRIELALALRSVLGVLGLHLEKGAARPISFSCDGFEQSRPTERRALVVPFVQETVGMISAGKAVDDTAASALNSVGYQRNARAAYCRLEASFSPSSLGGPSQEVATWWK